MQRLTFAEFRALTPSTRSKVLSIGLARYAIADYVGPIVAAGLRAIEKATSELTMRDYDEDDMEDEARAYRDLDAGRVTSIRSMLGDQKDDYTKIGDLKLDWPIQHKTWRTWGGQQTLSKLIAKYLDAMAGWSRDCDALDYEAGLIGVSGLMPGHEKVNALDMGFSTAGMNIVCNPWREVAMLIGIQYAPILVRDDLYAVHWHGDWHSWKVIERVRPYYWAFSPQGHRQL
jgi:hypothetical protein